MQSPGSGLLTGDSPKKARPALLKWILRLLVGVIIVGVLVRWQGAQVGHALTKTSPYTLIFAVTFYLVAQLVSALRWRLLLNAAVADHQKTGKRTRADALSLWESYRLYLIGMFCNLWLPTAVGGDAIRAAMAAKKCGSLSLAASSILVERLTGLTALLLIGVVGLVNYFGSAASEGTGTGRERAVAIIAVAVLAVASTALLVWALRRAATKAAQREEVPRLMQKLLLVHQAFDAYFKSATRPALLGAIALSFLFQCSLILLNIYLAGAVGLQLPPAVFVWLIPCLSIASMIPLGIGGLGVREASAVALLGGALPASVALEPGTIIAWSLLAQAMLWLSGLPGAFAYFTQREPEVS